MRGNRILTSERSRRWRGRTPDMNPAAIKVHQLESAGRRRDQRRSSWNSAAGHRRPGRCRPLPGIRRRHGREIRSPLTGVRLPNPMIKGLGALAMTAGTAMRRRAPHVDLSFAHIARSGPSGVDQHDAFNDAVMTAKRRALNDPEAARQDFALTRTQRIRFRRCARGDEP